MRQTHTSGTDQANGASHAPSQQRPLRALQEANTVDLSPHAANFQAGAEPVERQSGLKMTGTGESGGTATLSVPDPLFVSPSRPARTAVVHDWLPVYAGAERVLEQILEVTGESELFSLIDALPEEQRGFLGGRSVNTSFIQRLPFSGSKYPYYMPLAPLAIEQFDLNGFDLVISSSYAVAKGVLTTADQYHICYLHSPARYAWDLHAQYLDRDKRGRGLRGALARLFLHYIRLFDVASAHRVDAFVANSQHVARRVWNTYRRRATVIYPPVNTDAFTLCEDKQDFYVTLSRLVPYKRVDLIVEAFSSMHDKELFVIGEGPAQRQIEKMAGPNVTVLGYQPAEAVQYYLKNARGFVFAAEEDFGIVPVEAQACGTPVIAYGRGGARETVVHGETGLLFAEQTAECIRQAVRTFEAMTFSPRRIRTHAEQFSQERFRREFQEYVLKQYASFKRRTSQRFTERHEDVR